MEFGAFDDELVDALELALEVLEVEVVEEDDVEMEEGRSENENEMRTKEREKGIVRRIVC